ncbi:squalene epoxidase [Rhodocollybia butyracea]|uniref:Squalene monooxygenase n=1 Tax=Rhodocollybia butyracea TaxID=206335 RepID=A0A9P5UB79_9AGAR|nr:squalene epoxidase [Rhodocollybia butyracea]
MPDTKTPYDVIVIGAGIAGCSFAHALASTPRKQPLRIALLERSLEEPDRIVGELLQPGGVMALRQLGLEDCLQNIDSIPVHGYCVAEKENVVHIPYPKIYQGRSFHHGRFIMNLRSAAKKAKGVEIIEATVNEFIESETSQRVNGVVATKKNGTEVEKVSLYAHLVVVADGCFSNFRSKVMGPRACTPVTKSYFVGAVLDDATLPYQYHGTVCLTESLGPVLLYQIGTHDTRMLVDVRIPVPSDLKTHILENVVPQLPSALHKSVTDAVQKGNLRKMPNSFLPSVVQGGNEFGCKKGVFLVGDAWNMRHPLTGGGMTVAFNDAVLLRDILAQVEDFSRWDEIGKGLRRWHWDRKPLASTVNILSVALYDLFGANDDNLQVLRTGCFKYFERGGECVNGPVSLLAVTVQSPATLFYHFFSVAFYSIWVMFTHPRLVQRGSGEKPRLLTPGLDEYPGLFVKTFVVIWTAIVVFLPLLWSEVRWWSPDDKNARKTLLFRYGVPVAALATVAIGAFTL